MINEETIHKLKQMRLHAMAEYVQALLRDGVGRELSTGEHLGLLIEQEWTARENRRLEKLLKDAKIPGLACCVSSRTSRAMHAHPAPLARTRRRPRGWHLHEPAPEARED